MNERYRVLVADPPWPFNDQLDPRIRGAATQYDILSVQDIKKFPLPPMYHYSTLFLWRVAAMQQEALDVIAAWDFELKAEIVWKKLTPNGKRHFGMGRTVRMDHEVCLVATSGRPVTLDKSIRSVFEAATGRHSEKPEEFYKLVERLREGPYCELFARRQRAGWTCLGNETHA
jgi:N6-adenosine-specific RNA methylase IME4